LRHSGFGQLDRDPQVDLGQNLIQPSPLCGCGEFASASVKVPPRAKADLISKIWDAQGVPATRYGML
jgi:hypothetical protein